MGISLFALFGCASIGVYSLATNSVVLVPPQLSENKVEGLKEWLRAEVIQTTIGGSVLIGALSRASSKGIILPHFVREKETQTIRRASDLNMAIMETKRTAYGNSILANDHGAVVDPRIAPGDMKKIADTLDVEVVRGEIAGLPYVGSLATATNKGVLAHPMLREEEEKVLADVLKVPVDVGTINCGVPYVSTGLIGNDWGAVAGSLTTGPEMFIIGQALDVVEEPAQK